MSVKPLGHKQLVQASVIAGVAAVAWYVGVRALEKRHSDMRAELVRIQDKVNEHEQIQQIAATANGGNVVILKTAESKATDLAVWAHRSGDQTRLYDDFRVIAKARAVRIERIEPSVTRVVTLQWPEVAPPEVAPGAVPVIPPKRPDAQSFGYRLEVTGTYENVARFINDCETTMGASRVSSFRIAPSAGTVSSGGAIVSASIETSHLKLPEVDGMLKSGTTKKEAGK